MSRCYANRVHLIAALMLEMGLDIADVGLVAEAIIDIQCEPDVPAEAEPDVLDAKELNL